MSLSNKCETNLFPDLETNQLSRTLFIISCSSRKNPENKRSEKWADIINKEDYSKFQEFSELREKMLKFYSTINSKITAQDIYRGYKSKRKPFRWRNAWQTNNKLVSSRISRAIYRYTGNLYKKLDYKVLQQLADNNLNNILIISALNGPTLPSDYLPYYDLTMLDIWKDKIKLRDKWPLWIINYSRETLTNFLKKFDRMCVMVGDNYKPTVKAIKRIAPNIRNYQEAPSFQSKSSFIWGIELNKYLLARLKS